LHYRTVRRPGLHVFGRISEPFGDVEHLLPARFVVTDVEIKRVADHQRRRVGCEAIADEGIPAIFERLLRLCRGSHQADKAEQAGGQHEVAHWKVLARKQHITPTISSVKWSDARSSCPNRSSLLVPL